MKPNILISGASGAGKSSSLRNLDPEKTLIINTERKVLPFRGAGKFKKQVLVDSYHKFQSALDKAESNTDAEILVIDSFTSLSEQIMCHAKQTWSGFNVYSGYASIIYDIFQRTKLIDKYVAFIGIDEPLQDDAGKITRHLRVDGKAMKGAIEKEFSVVLWATVIKDGDNSSHRFETNNDGTTTAKTPMDMFGHRYIDNDLAMVISEIKKYYEE